VKIGSLFSTSVERAGFFLLILLLAAPMAGAQEMDLPGGVPDRVAPESDAMGTGLGGFTAYPKLGFSTAYDSNIFAIDSQVESDARFVIDPSLSVKSNWSSNELSLGGFLSSSSFVDNTSEDKIDWGIGTSGRLDVLEGSNIKAMLGYQGLTEDRGGIDAVNVSDPVEYGHLQAGLVANHRINQLTLSGGIDFQSYDYDPSSQKFRDRDLLTITGQGGYNFSPGYSGFFRGEFSDRNFQNLANPLPLPAAPNTRPSQDSQGYELVVGVASEITNLISGEASVGYFDQDYDSSALKDVSGVSFGVDLEWEVTQMTSVRLTASQDVVDSTSAGSGGILYSNVGFGVDHELTPEAHLKFDFGFYNGEYKGIDRDDDGIRIALGADYRLSRHVHLDLLYSFEDRDSNVAGQDFTRNQIIFGVRLQH
jgi:hypothetical protein